MKKNAPVQGHRASKMITLTDPSIMCSVPLPAGGNIGCSVPAKCLGGGRCWAGLGWRDTPLAGARENVKETVMEAEGRLSRPIHHGETSTRE